MKKYDLIVIGFGKAGKMLASTYAKQGKKTALIEKSSEMYGGTCINVACIPSKRLEYMSRQNNKGKNILEKKEWYLQTIKEKNEFVKILREKNYKKLIDAGVEIIDGKASFIDQQTIVVEKINGLKEELKGEKILINTGAIPRNIPIKGLESSSLVYTSESLMNLEKLPEHLTIIGGGYIGLEFASYYIGFGSKVTIIVREDQILSNEDQEIANEIINDLKMKGIQILTGSQVKIGKEEKDCAVLTIETIVGSDVKEQIIKTDAILTAVGRIPNTISLDLDKAGIQTDEKGAIIVDKNLKTTNSYVWAAGDVKGGMQFTYISLDDYRILLSSMSENKDRTTENRGHIPFVLFINPPYAKVGLSEEEAKKQGKKIKTSSIFANQIPNANVIKQPYGKLKVIIDEDTDLILGAHLYCAHSNEIIHVLKLAIDYNIPYSSIKNSIFAHPSISEALNDLF